MFVLGQETEKYLKKQRTNYRKAKNVGEVFYQDLQEEVKKLTPYLPNRDKFTVVEIGCGIGGISVVLQNLYPEAKVYMFDKDGTNRQGGWHKNDKFCNSLELTRKFVEDNVWVDTKPIIIDDIKDVKHKADLIISSLSMGFHYGMDQYADFIDEKLKKTGKVIVDLRNPSKSEHPDFLKKGDMIEGSLNRKHRQVYERK